MLRRQRIASVALLALAGCLAPARDALAFERQWHLGGGVGIGFPPGSYELGPAAGLHAAYGISDVFDLRLDLVGSRHAREKADSVTVASAAGGIVYKLDIIEWVPYFGVHGGYQLATPEPVPGDDLRQSSALVGVVAGVDYGFSRSFGMGLAYREDYLTASGAFAGLLLLRAEYRFGW